ncbi:MAG: glycosyltransferase family 9 protein, partial [Chloroflexi bacterium]|nr:glycosyltransferase family 9 protein [Chloroflexota bacterium]
PTTNPGPEPGAFSFVVGASAPGPGQAGLFGQSAPRLLNLAGRTTIPELVALLARCRLVVSGDSAPLHLAGALGVPAVAIHGPSDPALSGPFRASAIVVRRPLGCSPCYDLSAPADCPYDNPICMTDLPVDEVLAACRKWIGVQGSRSRVQGSGDEVQSSGFTVQSSESKTQGAALDEQQSPTPDPRPPTPGERVLIVKLADIGDVLAMTPALRALRQSHPRWRLTALVSPGSAAVLADSPLVDEVVVFDKFQYDRLGDALKPGALLKSARFLLDLRRRRFDRVVLFHHLVTQWGAWKFAALALATGAAERLGLDNGRGWFLTRRVPDGGFGGLHEVEYAMELARAWDAGTQDRTLDLPVGVADRELVAQVLGSAIAPIVAIHPGAGPYAPARRWSLDGFAAVAQSLAADGATVVVVGGQAERELGARVAAAAGDRAVDLTGMTTLGQLGAVLAHCDLFIGGDSGVTHVATAVRAPVLAIFGPSNPAAWGPWTDGQSSARVLAVDLPCRPCLYVGRHLGQRHGCEAMTCLQSITAETVLAHARAMLGRSSG